MKTLSIIITAHNLYPLIKKCLQSVNICLMNLPVADYELLLIDDKSDDETTAVLQDFAQHHDNACYIRTEFANIGKVRNYALSQANGEYITFIDGDDILPAFNVHELCDFLRQTTPDLLLSRMYEVKAQQDICWKSQMSAPKMINQQQAMRDFLKHKKFQSHLWGKYIKRSLFDVVKIPDILCYEDYYVMPDLLNNAHCIYYSNAILYNYMKRNNSLTARPDTTKIIMKAQAILHIIECVGEAFRHLAVCHAIDFLLSCSADQLAEKAEKADYVKLSAYIKKLNKIAFLLDGHVRLSFKRKLFRLIRKLSHEGGHAE